MITHILVIALSVLSLQQEPVLTLHLVGDSTMSDKRDPEINPEFGWGQVLPRFFTNEVLVKNHAVNGRSTKSFIDEGRWDAVMEEIEAGDYVFIQFGHNDEKINDPSRYTAPNGAYRQNLEKFINETRAKDAYPVIFTSIVRRHFDAEGTLLQTHGEYPAVVREIASELVVPIVDLEVASRKLVELLGPEGSKTLYVWVKPGENAMYPEGREDNTHLSEQGAMEIARMALEGIFVLDLPLAEYVRG